MSLYELIVGHPWVYNYLRPAFLGGVNYSLGYGVIEQSPEDVVLDFGCGYGDALRYIRKFREYHGFDIDHRAIAHMRRAYGTDNDSGIFTYPRTLTSEDVLRIRPNKVVIAGALHHLSDTEVTSLLQQLSVAGSVRQIVTIDVVMLPGLAINNALALLDRGKFVRTPEKYIALFDSSSFTVKDHFIDDSNRWARYFVMNIVNHPSQSG